MGAFAEIGARLIERGYAAVPIMPGTKMPGVLKNGEWVGMEEWESRYIRKRPSQALIARWSKAAPASAWSAASAAWWQSTSTPTIPRSVPRSTLLPPTSVRKIGKRGETLFYYAPHITKSKRWRIDGKVVSS